MIAKITGSAILGILIAMLTYFLLAKMTPKDTARKESLQKDTLAEIITPKIIPARPSASRITKKSPQSFTEPSRNDIPDTLETIRPALAQKAQYQDGNTLSHQIRSLITGTTVSPVLLYFGCGILPVIFLAIGLTNYSNSKLPVVPEANDDPKDLDELIKRFNKLDKIKKIDTPRRRKRFGNKLRYQYEMLDAEWKKRPDIEKHLYLNLFFDCMYGYAILPELAKENDYNVFANKMYHFLQDQKAANAENITYPLEAESLETFTTMSLVRKIFRQNKNLLA